MVLYWITALKIKYWYVCQFYLFKFIQSLTFDFERFFKAFLPTRLQDWRAKHLPAHYGTLNVDPSSIELILKEVKDQTKHARSELQRIVSFFLSSVECRACWLLDKDSSHCISDILQTVKPWRPFHFLTPYWSVSVFPLILTPFQSYNLNLTCCLTYSSTTWECAMEVKCLIQRKWLGCLQMTAVCGLHSWSVFCLTLSLQVKYYLWPFSRTLQRIMVANYTINRDRYPKKTIWNAIDDQLDSLRPKSLRERYAYVLFIFSGVHLSFDFDCLMSSPLYILCIGCWSQSDLLQWYINSPWSRYWNKTAPTISTTARRRCQCHEHAIWLQRNHERGHLPVGVDLDTTNYYCTFLNSDKLVRCRTNFHPSLFCFSF